MKLQTVDLRALQRAIAGDVVVPGSPAYETARKPAMARYEGIHPSAVVRCSTPEDVAETIAFARHHEIAAVPRSGGHCFAGHSSTYGLVIDVSPMRSVSVANGEATIGAGARLGDIYDTLDAHGLTIPAGCGPTVGIAGLTLGGGLGILGRKHGLTLDHLIAAEAVLADGRIINCDAEDEPELFWALRGAGGGNFGIVTALTFKPLHAPPATAFHLIWPFEQATAVVAAWQDWAPDAPDELAASLLLTAFGDSAQPAALHLFGAMLGNVPDTTSQLEAMIQTAGPPSWSFQQEMAYREAKRYLAEHGPGEAQSDESTSGQSFSKSEFFRQPLNVDVIEALVANFERDRMSGESRVLDFSPWRGAYNRVPADATAFPHRDERFLLKHEVIIDSRAPDNVRDGAQRWLQRSWDIVHASGSGGVYPNFPDPDLLEWASAYYGDNLARLMVVKRRYDPEGVFSFQQSIPVAVPER